MTNLSLFVFK